MRRILVPTLLVGGLVGLFIWTGFFLYNKNQEKPIVYKTESPAYRDIINKTVATGSVVPRKEIEIKPQVSGLVKAIYVEPGDVVKTGDLIATVRIIPNMVTLNNAESRVKRAEISLKNARRDYERNKKLAEEGVIAAAVYQQFELTYDNAKEEMAAAKDNLELIREGATQRSGNSSNTNIRATISGMVLDVPVEEGNSVIEANTFNDGTTIAVIANMDEMIFEGKVDESEVGKISEGMDLLLTIGAIEEEKFHAKLEHISPKGVAENGAIQFEIRAAVQLKENQFIRAGYSANADIVLERKDSVLAISESLLIFEDNKPYVEVERIFQRFEKVPVETGLSDGIYIEVLSGLDTDAKIKNPNAIVEE
ncbi:MAG: efflux RND transporter periplasmic adaptor subunit [Bacteroidetes bacterium]|nr:efflux RND transporter periplasmic adaptor subunit [Bacteroidota bacterium]MCB0841908.1 efflux RND transporter periplasmic adaptor subunit [Bacteroidota bacterium]MCB0855859.1 efflux RND transporter periplasmic adaptor subunit [Bacteroidota bacterium]